MNFTVKYDGKMHFSACFHNYTNKICNLRR
jgi:hypothetical protein